LRGEGHSAAGWGIGGSVWLQTAGSKVRSFGQWAAATCAAPLNVVCHCRSVRHFE